MNFAELLLLSLSLAIDCFAVSCVVGVTQPNLDRRYVVRFSLSFGLFQGGMPLIGWLLGEGIVSKIGKVAPFIALAILCFLGGKMIVSSLKKENGEHRNIDVRELKNVLLLSIATSIDALAVGFSFAMIDENITVPVIVIGVTSFLVSLFAYKVSRTVSNEKISNWAELIGGLVLISIGVKIFFF